MKTNNRPMVKEIKDIDMGYAGREVIEVERPMNDTEYIEYLEKENKELKEQVNSNAEIATKAIERVNQLENPIQFGTLATMSFTEHNKETLYTQAYVDKQQDQFLKVVESVLGIHIHMNYKCSCGWESETDTFGDHLLQEIKSSMEKGKDGR